MLEIIGFASGLITIVAEIAKRRGCEKLFVNSYWKNEKAISFYEKNGFEKIDVSLEKII